MNKLQILTLKIIAIFASVKLTSRPDRTPDIFILQNKLKIYPKNYIKTACIPSPVNKRLSQMEGHEKVFKSIHFREMIALRDLHSLCEEVAQP